MRAEEGAEAADPWAVAGTECPARDDDTRRGGVVLKNVRAVRTRPAAYSWAVG